MEPCPRHDRVNASSFQAIVDTRSSQSLVIKSLLPQVPITVFSQLWVTHDQWFVNNFLQMAVQATLMTSTQRQSKCHKPILIFAIFQIYTKLPITNLQLVRNKQQSCSSTFPGCCCEDWEDKIIVGSVLSALWWCWDSSGLISADPQPCLTDHILPFPSPTLAFKTMAGEFWIQLFGACVQEQEPQPRW